MEQTKNNDTSLKPVIQKNGEPWTDEQRVTIPFNRITKTEKDKERMAGNIFKDAYSVSAQLLKLHAGITKAFDSIAAAAAKEEKTLTKKGGFTWYNFDKSIKISADNNDTVKFDQAKIASARELLETFIKENTAGTDDIIRQLINTAFHNTKGGLDSKKVLSLCKFRNRTKDKRFHDAIDLIESSQIIDKSKRYFRVWVKDEAGKYQNINLQFSAI